MELSQALIVPLVVALMTAVKAAPFFAAEPAAEQSQNRAYDFGFYTGTHLIAVARWNVAGGFEYVA
jgi:hypothetical protein